MTQLEESGGRIHSIYNGAYVVQLKAIQKNRRRI